MACHNGDDRQARNARERERYRASREPAPQPNLFVFETFKYTEIEITNPEDSRFGETITVPVYSVGALGDAIGKSAPTIRLWESQGILPPATLRSDDAKNQRYYTYDQVAAIFERFPLTSEVAEDGRENSTFALELRRIWELMPDGVWPGGEVLPVSTEETHYLPNERYIYALVDPVDGFVKYIGKAASPSQRKDDHISQALNRQLNQEPLEPKDVWLLGLHEQELEPCLVILQTTSETVALEVEANWITLFRERGSILFNRYPYLLMDEKDDAELG